MKLTLDNYTISQKLIKVVITYETSQKSTKNFLNDLSYLYRHRVLSVTDASRVVSLPDRNTKRPISVIYPERRLWWRRS